MTARVGARWRGVPAAAALALAVAGCGVLEAGGPEQAVQTYVLSPRVAAAPAPAPLGPEVYVAPLVASAPYDSPRMAYMPRPGEIAFFANNEWAAEPARLIEPWLIASLEASGAFATVLKSSALRGSDLRLDAELLTLRQEFDSEPSRVRVELRVELSDLREPVRIETARFEAVESAPSNDPYGGVMAADRALTRVLEELRAFCVRAVAAAR